MHLRRVHDTFSLRILIDMRKELRFVFILFLLSILSSNVFAAKRYWIKATAAYWNNTANWSATSGGAPGASVPGSSDTAYFNGSGVGNDTINATVNIKRLEIASGFTGKILQGANAITVGTGGAVLSGGTFTGGSSSITVSGSLTISGTAFTSTSNTLSVAGSLTISSGSFTHNNGIVALTATSTLTVSRTGGVTFYKLSFAPTSTATFTITSTTSITVSNLFSYDGSAAITLNSGTISAQGNLTVNNNSTGGGGSATINITGTSPTITGPATPGRGVLPNVSFITGSGSSATFTLSKTITIGGTLATYGGGSQTFNTDTLSPTGNVYLRNSGTGGGGSAIISFTNTNSQTLRGNATVGNGSLPKVVINKSAGTLTLDSTISVANNWTWTAGTFSLGTSTVAFLGTSTIAGSHTLGNVTFKSNSTTTYTISNTLTVSGTLKTDGTGALTFNTGTIAAQGNVTVSNSSTGGGGSATIKITGTTPTITGPSTAGQGVLPNVSFVSGSSATFTISNKITIGGTLATYGTGSQTFNQTVSTDTLYTTGNIYLRNSGSTGGGSASIKINGSGAQTLRGNATIGNASLPIVVINKSAGTLTLDSVISVANNWKWAAGTLSVGTSTVAFVATNTITGNHTLGNVTFKSNSSTTYTISNTLTVSGTLTTDGTGSLTFNTGTIAAQGTITLSNSGTGGGGSATISLTNTNDQTLTGNSTVGYGALPKVTISKSSGTLTLVNTISVANNWTWTQGAFSLGSSTVAFVGSLTISGSHTLGNVWFKSNSSATYTISNTLTVSGNLATYGNGALTFNTGTIAPTGNIYLRNIGQGGSGTATINISGTGSQSLIGTSMTGRSCLPKVTINKSGTLTLDSIISVGNDWTWSAGAISAGASTVTFLGQLTVTGSHTLGNVRFYCSASDYEITFTIASGTVLTVSGTLAIEGYDWDSSVLLSGTGTIAAQGNINISNIGTGGGGTATIRVDGSSPTITATGYGGMLPNVNFVSNSSATYTIDNTVTVGGTLATYGTGSLTFNGGNIVPLGNVKLRNSGTGGGGSATIYFYNSPSLTLTGNATVGNGSLPKVSINMAGNTLTLDSTISVANNWTFSAGTLSTGTSTVAFLGTSTITGTHTLKNVIFKSNSSTTYTIASGNTLTVSGTLATYGTGTLYFNTGTIAPTGNMFLRNSGTGGGGTATINITTTNNDTLKGNGTVGNGALPKVTINKGGGTLTLDSIISVANNWTWSAGTLGLGNSTVAFTNSLTITGKHTLGNVTFNSNSATTFTLGSSDTLTINGTMKTMGSGALTYSTGVIRSIGNILLTSTASGGGGTATLLIAGSSNQSITGYSGISVQSKLPNVKIEKSGGNLSLSNTISVGGNWTYSTGTIVPGTSGVLFVGTKTISGTHSLAKVGFSAGTYTVSTGTILTVNDTLAFLGASPITINTGTIEAAGNILIANTGTGGGGGDGTLHITGTSNQVFTGSGTAGAGIIPGVNIEKTGGTLTIQSVLSCGGNFIYTNGTVNAGTSTVVLYGTSNLDGQMSGAGSMMPFYNLTIGGNTRTLTGNLDVNNNLAINSGATLSAGSNDIFIGGNWTNTSGTWTCGSGKVTFDGIGYNYINHTSGGSAATESFYKLGFNRDTCSHTLNCPVVVGNILTLTKGHIKTTSSNYIELSDNATITGGGDSAYVHGPMRKTGNDAFTFPLGDTTLVDTAYHPLAITAPSSTSDQFEAAYYANASSHAGGPLEDTLESVSDCEYWTCEQKIGSSSVAITLSWNKNSCLTTGTEEMTIAKWDGTQWVHINSTVTTYSGTTGSMSTTDPIQIGGPIHLVYASKKLLTVYVPSRPQLDGFTARSYGKKLYVIYNEKYQSGNLNYTIYDMQHSPISTSNSPVTKEYGQNWLKINLAPISGLIINKYYVLEIQNEKGQKEYVRFCLR